jgi:hypothetical protein
MKEYFNRATKKNILKSISYKSMEETKWVIINIHNQRSRNKQQWKKCNQ